LTFLFASFFILEARFVTLEALVWRGMAFESRLSFTI